MKKIRILALILAVLSVICIGVLASCDDDTEGGTCANGEHEWAKWVSNRDASCETDGTHTRKCAKCGEKQTEVEVGSAYGMHTYGSAVSNGDATCENDGTETLTCIICKKPMTRTEEGSALGHAYGKDPISETNGYSVKKCVRCDHTTRSYSGVVDQNFEGGFKLEDYSEQLAISEKADWSIKTDGGNSYLFIQRSADKVLGDNAFALKMTPDYEKYRNNKYVVEYKMLISENTKDMVLLVGKKGDAEQVFAEYDADDGKIKVQGEAVYDVTKGQWLTLAFVLSDRDRSYDLYADGHQVISAAAYTNAVYYTSAALENFAVRMATANKMASEFGIDDIKIEAGDAPKNVVDSLVKEKATVTIGEYTISYIKPKDGCEHEWSELATVAPTCYIAGYQVKTCSKCGGQEVNSDTTTVTAPAKHDYEIIAKKDPTCTEDGYCSSKCKNCGNKNLEDALTTPKVYAAKGHTEKVGTDKDPYEPTVTAPTCTEKGYTTKHCSVCDQDYQDTFVDALGHAWATSGDKYTAPGCETVGHTYCTREGCTEEKDIEALGHNWSVVGEEGYTAPTCEKDGSAKCKNPGCEASDTIEKLGHIFKLTVDTEDHKLCWACTREGCTHSEDVTYVTALPSYTELIAKLNELGSKVMEKLDLSGETAGAELGYKQYGTIQFVGGSGRNQKWSVLDNGGTDGVDKYARWNSSDGTKHAYINIGTTKQSLKWNNAGVFEFAIRLGEPGADGKYFRNNALQLIYRGEDENIKSSPSIAYFDEDGNFVFGSGDDAVTIKLSEEKFTRIAIAIDQKNKTLDLYVDGMLIVWKMQNGSIPDEISEIRMLQSNVGTVGIGSWYDVANIIVYEGKAPTHITGCVCDVINAEHEYEVSNVVDPTCTAEGYTVKVCKNCGDTMITDPKGANGHDIGVKDEDGKYTSYYTEDKKDATCTEKGYLKAQCKDCEEWILIEEYDLAKHDLGTKDEDGNITYYEKDEKDPTCTEAGYLKAKCKVCEQWIDIETYQATDHTLSDTDPDGKTKKDEATCTEKGYEYQWCSKCESWIVSKTLDANGHKWAKEGEDGYTAPSCEVDGSTICKNGCGASETIAKLGHSYKLTEKQSGKLYVTCDRGCGYKKKVEFVESFPTYAELMSKVNALADTSFAGMTLVEDVVGTTGAYLGSGHIWLNMTGNKYSVKNDGIADDGIEEYLRWYGHSTATDGHSYINIGMWNNRVTYADNVVFEFALRLGEPDADGKYFAGSFDFINRTGTTVFASFGWMDISGKLTFKDGGANSSTTIQFTKDEFTRVAVVVDVKSGTMSVYEDGILIAKGLKIALANADGTGYAAITELRVLQHLANSFVGIGSYYDIANIAVYEGLVPYAVKGVNYCAINGHTPDNGVVTAPTCEDEGYTTYTCTVCKESYKGDIVEKLGHDMQKDDEKSTYDCIDGGKLVTKCSRCDHTEEQVQAATGSHDFTSKVKDTKNSVAATCEEDGITYYICDKCGKSGKDCEGAEGASKVKKAKGHDFANSEEYDEANEPKVCQKNACRYKLCKNCGASGYDHQDEFGAKINYTPTADHTPGNEIKVKPTPTSNGSCKQYCTVCGELLKDDVLIYVAEGENELSYKNERVGYVVDGCTGDNDTIVIPATHPVDGKPIYGVDYGAFAGYRGKYLKIVIESEDFWIDDFFGEGATADDYLKVTYCFCFERPDDIDQFLQYFLSGNDFLSIGEETYDVNNFIFNYTKA